MCCFVSEQWIDFWIRHPPSQIIGKELGGLDNDLAPRQQTMMMSMQEGVGQWMYGVVVAVRLPEAPRLVAVR